MMDLKRCSIPTMVLLAGFVPMGCGSLDAYEERVSEPSDSEENEYKDTGVPADEDTDLDTDTDADGETDPEIDPETDPEFETPTSPCAAATVEVTPPVTLGEEGFWERGGTRTYSVAPLADALRNSVPGDIVRLAGGRYPTIGFGASNSSAYNVDHVSDVDICAAAGQRVVFTSMRTEGEQGSDTVSVMQKTPISHLRFWDILIEAGYRSGVIFGSHGDGSMIHEGFEFHNCYIDGGWDHATDTGQSSKWGMLTYRLKDFIWERGAIWDVRREHAFYHHNVAGDLTIRDMTAARLGRTFIQVVQRKNEGPLGTGTVLVENVTVEDCGLADGGSCLTVAGHADTTIFRNVTVMGGHDPELSGKKTRGAMVVWTPGGDNYWEGLYQNGTIVVENSTFDFVDGDRSLVALAGAETLVVRDNVFRTANGKRIEFDPVGTGNIQDNDPAGVEACGNIVEGAPVMCAGSACGFSITDPCD